MIDYKTALAVAEKITQTLVDAIRSRGPLLEFETHILPLLYEHYDIRKINTPTKGLVAVSVMNFIAQEIDMAGTGIDEEPVTTAVSLRLAGVILLCEKQFDWAPRESMRV